MNTYSGCAMYATTLVKWTDIGFVYSVHKSRSRSAQLRERVQGLLWFARLTLMYIYRTPQCTHLFAHTSFANLGLSSCVIDLRLTSYSCSVYLFICRASSLPDSLTWRDPLISCRWPNLARWRPPVSSGPGTRWSSYPRTMACSPWTSLWRSRRLPSCTGPMPTTGWRSGSWRRQRLLLLLLHRWPRWHPRQWLWPRRSSRGQGKGILFLYIQPRNLYLNLSRTYNYWLWCCRRNPYLWSCPCT